MSQPSVNQKIEELKVKEFFIAVLEDEVLLNRLETAMDALDDAAILDLATECGYNFTHVSLKQGLRNIVNLIAPVAPLPEQ